MPYIISTGTTVNFGGSNTGIISVNQSISIQAQRLFSLGTTLTKAEIKTIQYSLSLSCYAGDPPPTMDIATSFDCTEKDGITILVTGRGCGSTCSSKSGLKWFLTSYSYSKDPIGWGICNFSFTTAPEMDGHLARMLCGEGEGSRSVDGAECGVTLKSSYGTGVSLEVGTGSPGIGRCNNMEYGSLGGIGAALGWGIGIDGNGSASIPWTPLYI